MFTGLVRATGIITHVGSANLALKFVDASMGDIAIGDSIAVNGCCLTVTQMDGPASCGSVTLSFDLMPHTLEHTALGALTTGSEVNLEPALRAGDPLGGHMVQGHVDAGGTVTRTTTQDNALLVEIAAPDDVVRYCIPRGSVTVDGVSLTVVSVTSSSFMVSLIPETRERTTLGKLAPGALVNVESDVIARYVERLLPQG